MCSYRARSVCDLESLDFDSTAIEYSGSSSFVARVIELRSIDAAGCTRSVVAQFSCRASVMNLLTLLGAPLSKRFSNFVATVYQ